jgi:hypothetical protein
LQRFEYNSPKIFIDISNKFPLVPSLSAFGNIYRNKMYFGEEPHFAEGTLSK